MKKKQRTYLLLGLVLIIWGILGFKVIATLGLEEPPKEVVVLDKPYNLMLPIKKRDTFAIAANYRDPFLGTLPKSKKSKKVVKKKVSKPKPPKKNIVYSGSVAQNGTENRMFFVTINGQQHIMHKDQKINEVTLVWGSPESIKVKYPGHTETILLKQ